MLRIDPPQTSNDGAKFAEDQAKAQRLRSQPETPGSITTGSRGSPSPSAGFLPSWIAPRFLGAGRFAKIASIEAGERLTAAEIHLGDLRPVISQRVRSHEQPDMAARHGLLNDTVLCGPDIFCGIKDLLRCRDVVVCARQQIGGASDIVQIELPAETDELALGKPVLLEDLGDHLKIPASRQVNRVFVPALERLLLGEICRVVDVLVQIDMILNVVLLDACSSSPAA